MAQSLIEIFEQFLRDRNMLAEYQYNFKHYRFEVDKDKTFEQFCRNNRPENWISCGFDWRSTSRCDINKEKGERFYSNLGHEWVQYYKANSKSYQFRKDPVRAIYTTITGKKSIKDKLKDAIIDFFEALKDDEEFNGSVLAEYCMDRVGVKRKYPTTVLKYMNQLKKDYKLNYVCLSRSKSKYKKLAL